MSIMMKCGCAANAKRKVGDDYVPCCTIHDTIEQTAMPDLTGRMAICCGEKSLRPSDPEGRSLESVLEESIRLTKRTS